MSTVHSVRNLSSFSFLLILSSATNILLPSSLEADDLAQYLDHLLAHAAPKKPKRQAKGLGRFKAVATKTKEMVTLMNKAQDLNVHSEWIHHWTNKTSQIPGFVCY